MRRLARVVFAVVLVALAATGAAFAGRGDPKRAITRADQARAKAMLLRKSDLAAGFTASRRSKDEDFYCAGLDESDLTLTGDAESPDYTLQAAGRIFSIASQAQLYRSSSQSLASWRLGTSSAGERCAARQLASVIAGSGGSFRSLKRIPFPKVAPLTVAYRVTAELAAGQQKVPAYMDVVVLQRGRAQVAFVVFSVGAPLVRSETLAFARLTAVRMKKAMAR
jgi:hypothetical protein